MVIDLKKCTIMIKDGASQEIEVKIGEGNLSYTEKRNIEYFKDKGNLDTCREGEEEPVDVKFDFRWEHLSGTTTTGTYPSIEEAIKGIGAAKDWTSSSADTCEPFAIDIEIEHDPSTGNVGCTDSAETVTLRDFRWESFDHDLKAGTVSCSGKCNVTAAEITRAPVS